MQAGKAISGGHGTCIKEKYVVGENGFLPARGLTQQSTAEGLFEPVGRGSTGRGCVGNALGQHPCRGAQCHRCP